MPPCCENNCCSLNATHERQRKTLRFVLAINALMFFVIAAAAIVSHSAAMLPWGLGFAAGAMLFVISHEIIPESHRKGHEAWATTGLMLGFVLMMILDTSLGG